MMDGFGEPGSNVVCIRIFPWQEVENLVRRNLEARFGSDAGWNGLSHAGGAQNMRKIGNSCWR